MIASNILIRILGDLVGESKVTTDSFVAQQTHKECVESTAPSLLLPSKCVGLIGAVLHIIWCCKFFEM